MQRPALAQGPFDPDYDLFSEPPRRRSNPPWRKPQPGPFRPRLDPICRWCMERTVNPIFYECSQNPHPHFCFLCERCRIEVRMWIQRLAMHRAMTLLQATQKVMSLMDLDNHLLPE